MRQPFQKTNLNLTHAALPVVCALSAAIVASLGVALPVIAQSSNSQALFTSEPAAAVPADTDLLQAAPVGVESADPDPAIADAAIANSAIANSALAEAATSVATDPFARAKEIAALAPATERQDLRKEEIKELSVVMSGVELVQRANIEKVLDIWAFHEKDIPSVSRLRFMHRKAQEQIGSALRPYGYYRSEITVARLSNLGTKWQAVYRIKPGDRVAVGNASVKITGSGADEPEFQNIMAFAEENIRREQVLDQQLYDALKSNIRSAAAKMGYFDAEFTAQEIVVDLDSYTADVSLHFSTGDRYKIGKITLAQDREWLSEELLDKFVDLKENDYFDAGEIQKVQSGFGNTAYYRNVQVRASADDAVDKTIPVDVELIHRNPKQYIYGLGYGTDTRARARLGAIRRRVNRSGHHYEVQAIVSEIGFGVGYNYVVPTRDPRTDSFGLGFNIEEEDSVSKNFRSVAVGGYYSYRDDHWFKTFTLDYEVEEDIPEDSSSTLLIPGVEWTRTTPIELIERLNVYRGNSIEVMLRGASDSVLSDTSFIQAKVSGKSVFSYENGNRIILRAAAGATRVSDFSQLPLSKRFFTGGDTTIRGYDFDVISPLEDDESGGGKYLIETSVEYEVPFRTNFTWAAFMDAGDAFNDNHVLRNSFGFGVRWRSPIGPIRVDAARGLDEPSNGQWRFHLTIGPDL